MTIGSYDDNVFRNLTHNKYGSYDDLNKQICSELLKIPKNSHLKSFFDGLFQVGEYHPKYTFFELFVLSGGLWDIASSENTSALPFSCYVRDIDNNIEDISDAIKDGIMLTSSGGGIGANFSNISHRGKVIKSKGIKHDGVLGYLKTFASGVDATKQGSRRGAVACYLSCNHPDIEDFLKVRDPQSTSFYKDGHALQTGVIIEPDFKPCLEKYIKAYKNNEISNSQEFKETHFYPLRDRTTNEIVSYMNPLEFVETLAKVRGKTGSPYLYFREKVETANKINMSWEYPQTIPCSNLCSEITVRTNSERNLGVCCIGAIHFSHFLEGWMTGVDLKLDVAFQSYQDKFLQGIDLLYDAIYEYALYKVKTVNKLKIFEKSMEQVYRNKDIGIGCFGVYDAFASLRKELYAADPTITVKDVKNIKDVVFSTLKDCFDTLNKLRGRTKLSTAIAPTTSTSRIFRSSPGIFPHPKLHGEYDIKRVELSNIVELNANLGLDDSLFIEYDYLYKGSKEAPNHKEMTDLISDLNKHVNQAISYTFSYEVDTSLEIMTDDLLYTILKSEIKTLYYVQISRNVKRATKECIPCSG